MKKQIIIIFFILLITTVLMLSKLSQEYEIIINNEKYVLENEKIDLKTFNSEEKIVIKNNNIFCSMKINGKAVGLGEKVDLGKVKISRDNIITIEIKPYFQKEYQIYAINTLDSQFPEYISKGTSDTDDGNYYMTTFYKVDSPYYIFKINNQGEIVYYQKMDTMCFDFRRKEQNGKIRYTYLIADKTKNNFNNGDVTPCKLVVMNEKYEIIDEVSYQYNNELIGVDNHGYMYLEDGHYIIPSWGKVELENIIIDGEKKEKILLNNSKIQELKDGKILWEWDCMDYPELIYHSYYRKKYNKENPIDFCHFNSMTLDPEDNNLLCSFRNLGAVVKINRKTGKTMWILGGSLDEFGLTEKQKFHYQHSLSFTRDGYLLLLDNGDNTNTLEESRVLKIKLEEEEKRIQIYEEMKLPQIYSKSMGSVQETNDGKSYLLCYGIGDFRNSNVEEIDIKTNEKLFTFQIKNNKSLYNVNKF